MDSPEYKQSSVHHVKCLPKASVFMRTSSVELWAGKEFMF